MTYTCDNCLKTFDEAWSDEEASAEFNKDFPTSEIRDAAIVCDDCYKEMVAWKTPEQYTSESPTPPSPISRKGQT